MIPEDRRRSPYTGWTREHWVVVADRMLTAVARYRSPAGARYLLPGPESVSGVDSDALEGFARTFLLAGFRVAGQRGDDPGNLLERYAEGLAAGTDPQGAEAWPRPDHLGQAKVEAASVALILQLTRPWLWDRLDGVVRDRVVDWLGTVVGQPYPQNNWRWFRIIVESFLREVAGPWSTSDIEEDLAQHAAFRAGEGWLSDGHGRHYDHYVGWALHLYPLLWTQWFDVLGTLCPARLRSTWAADLARYLDDALALIGADGSPLIQGRSLTYRFAAAAPLWVGALTEAARQPPGLLRRAASGMLRHFVDAGALEPDGILRLGWHRPWPKIRQAYSGPGSPYWASKGMLGLTLPADHPVWTDIERPLPVENDAAARVVTAPGWLVDARRDTGVVIIINHGTDHARPGAESADSPLYARLAYSTATAPIPGEPLDNAVVLLDPAGRPSHRTGFRTLYTRELPGRVLAAASSGPVRWTDTNGDNTGPTVAGPRMTVASVLRNGTEVRLVRADPMPGTTLGPLRLSGWPISSADPPVAATGAGPHATAGARLRSTVRNLHGFEHAGITRRDDVSPLGAHTAVPWLATADQTPPGSVLAAIVHLGHTDPPYLTLDFDGTGAPVVIWPDGMRTEVSM